eukprot:6328645-Prymnesium_polylepis.1
MLEALALEARLHSGLQPHTKQKVAALLRQRRVQLVGGGAARNASEGTPGEALGMHVRRGDACETLATPALRGPTDLDAPRRCYALLDYVDAARTMARLYGVRKVLLLTDSPRVVARLRVFDEFEWHWLEIDRARIGGKEHANVGVPPARRVYVEHRAAQADEANEAMVHSLLADLRFIARASHLVGTSRSFVSHAAQLLIWARSGLLPPVVSLEGDPLHTILHSRGRYWSDAATEDRGWIPCAYAWPHADAQCIECLNATASQRGADRCMHPSFLHAISAGAGGRRRRRCVDSIGAPCSLGRRLD